MRVAGVTICAGLLMALGQGTASAALDANCPGPPNSNFMNNGDERQAQTFTARSTGNLVRGQLEITKTGAEASAAYLLQILGTNSAGVPVNPALASTTIPDASVPLGDTTLAGTFATPALVVAGHQYALAVSRPGSAYTFRERDDNPCPGQEFFSPSQSDPFTGNMLEPLDLIFSVFVDPPNFTIGNLKGLKLFITVPIGGQITVVDAAQAAGSGANSAAKKKRRKRLRPSSTSTAAAGTIAVTLRLTKAAKGLLATKGKLVINPSVTFAPTGGVATTKTAKLKLKRKRKKK